MNNVVSDGKSVSTDIYIRLIDLQTEIDTRKSSIFKKYLPILTHLKIHDKNITKWQLIELKRYLGLELAKITRMNLKQIWESITNWFGLDSSDISEWIVSITSRITTKAEWLMNMESIGHSDSTGASQFEFLNIGETEMPLFLSRGWLRLPVDHKWTDLHDLIELIWLLIVQKEYIAEKIILECQANISERQASMLGGKQKE